MLGLKEYDNEYAERLYYMPTGPEREMGFWLLNAGRMIAKPNSRWGPKRSPFYTMYFVLAGEVVFEFGGQSVILNEGDVFCRFPNETVQYGLTATNPTLRMAWLSFHGETVFTLLQYIGLSVNRPYMRQAIPGQFPERLQQLLHEFRQLSEDGNYLRTIGNVFDLFGLLSASNDRRKEKDNGSRVAVSWLAQSIDFMVMHYTEGITVQDVADSVNLHRSHFSTAFTEQCGISPMQYLQQLRMGGALRMLKETEHSITEIALSLGYPDLYTFTKAFRKYYGNSPSHFRDNIVK